MSSRRPSSQRSPSSSRLADVAGVVPAVADRLLVGVRAVPVAGERLVRGHVAEDLAVLAEPEARVQRGTAGAPGLRGLVLVDRVRVDLGRAVMVDEQAGRERLDAPLDERARHRRARVGDRLDRAQVVLAELRMGDEVVVERGREIERGDPLALDQLERGAGVPVRLADVAAADQVHRDERVDAHRVVERHAAERPVAVAVALVDDLREAACAVGAVRARHALRLPGRPRGVEHQALVLVRRHRATPGAASPVGSSASSLEEERRARVVAAVGEVGRGRARRERDEGCTQPLARPVEEHRVQARAHDGGEPLFSSELEAARDARDAIEELRVRQPRRRPSTIASAPGFRSAA